jgi:heavy metal sensor kinase
MSFPESLRLRIQIWHGLLLATVLTGFALADYRYQAANDLRRLDTELNLQVRNLMDGLPSPQLPVIPGAPREFHLPESRAVMFESSQSAAYYYTVWRRDGSLWAHSTGAPADIQRPGHPASNEPLNGERTRGLLREAFMFTKPGVCLLVGRSMEPEQAALRQYARWLTAISSAVLVLGLTIGWWIATRAIRPIGVITSTAKRIARGELSERIPVREKNSELGRLSAVLNETFAQLDESFAREKRFTADAAHELRTPVAIILAKAQKVLARERDAATYKQTLEDCVSAARRLRQLTESLLTLAECDAGEAPLKLEDCDLADITRETAAFLQPLAEERGITLTCQISPARCRADPGCIAQVLLNLLTNALNHTPPKGSITLHTCVESGDAIFSITDAGPGIAAEHLPRIFDRFYRTDDSRSRHTGGAGLGLAICKAIADAHHARLEVSSIVGSGSTFTLRIPVQQASEAASIA